MNIMLENLYVCKELYSFLFHPICSKYGLTPAELLVLLFLASNAECDTAKDIVDKLKITKSIVSVSTRDLEERGYIKGEYFGRNRRTIHLQLCDTAKDIIAEARNVQSQFRSVLGNGFSNEELFLFETYLQRATDNINTYLKNSSAPCK